MPDKQQEKKERRLEKARKNEEQDSAEKKETMKKVVIAALILLAIPAFALLGRSLSEPTEGLNEENNIEIVDSDHVKGAENGSVEVVEYSDFQCPACAAYNPILKQIEEEYPDDVKIVYRHLPLKQIHPNAERAAQAAEAAHLQNAFFEMHDMLFDKQEEWSGSQEVDSFFLEYAKQLELDVEKFATDIDSKEVADRVENDIKTAYSLTLSSTPSFFVNGKKVGSPRGYEAFKEVIEKELNK